ncbi:phage portal protein [Bordetella genomosp. 9]|uniref:Phage portal protein n=2 Tax=Bordetella genomosp. 9 TaxID=1416803 RepID=A0A261RG52_9BORD|nr:phage portal protein [Bordetella genomosp. 9]
MQVLAGGLAASAKTAGQPSLKSSVGAWLGKRLGLTSTDFWSAWVGASNSGKPVTAQTALTVSAVWSCVHLIAETLATLPLDFYRRTSGAPVEAPEHPLHDLLRFQPNADMTAVQFWEMLVACLLLWGNSFVEIVRLGVRVTALNPLLPWRMQVRRLTDGSLEYTYSDLDGKQRKIAEADMWHIAAFSLDGVLGMSTIRYGANVFGAAMAADEASAKVFANGLNVGGVLSTEQILTRKQRDEYREDMEARFSGALNAGKTLVLEAGMKYQQVPMNPEDAQLLATRGFNVEEVCRWFRVFPWMVGHTEKSTSWGTGIEQQLIAFLTFTLRPWLTRIEQSIRKSLLPSGQRSVFYAKFSVEGLLRADSAARASFYSVMTQNGIYSRDDCREKENMPRRGGNADVLTVQSNLLPIDQLGKASSSDQQARAALTAWLNDDGNTGATQ